MDTYLQLPMDLEHVLRDDPNITNPIDRYADRVNKAWSAVADNPKIGQEKRDEFNIDSGSDIIAMVQPDESATTNMGIDEFNTYLEFLALRTEDRIIKSGVAEDMDRYSQIAYVQILTILVELTDLYRNDGFDGYHQRLGALLNASGSTVSVVDGISIIAKATTLLSISISSALESPANALQKWTIQTTNANKNVLVNVTLWSQLYRSYRKSRILAMDACIWYYNEIYGYLCTIRDVIRKPSYTPVSYNLDPTLLEGIHGDGKALPKLLQLYFNSVLDSNDTRGFQPGGDPTLLSHWLRDLMVAVKALVYHATVYRLRPMLANKPSILDDVDEGTLSTLRSMVYTKFAGTTDVVAPGITNADTVRDAIRAFRTGERTYECPLSKILGQRYVEMLELALPDCQSDAQIKTEMLLEYLVLAAPVLDKSPSEYRGLIKTVIDIANNLRGLPSNLDAITTFLRSKSQVVAEETRKAHGDLYTCVRIRDERERDTDGVLIPSYGKGKTSDSGNVIAIKHRDYTETTSTEPGERGKYILGGHTRDYSHVFGPFSYVSYQTKKLNDITANDEAEHMQIANDLTMVPDAIKAGRNVCVVLTGPSGSGKSSLGIYLKYYPKQSTDIADVQQVQQAKPVTARGILPLICTGLGQTGLFKRISVNIVEVIKNPNNAIDSDCVEVMNLPDDGRGADNYYRQQMYVDKEFTVQNGDWYHTLQPDEWQPGTEINVRDSTGRNIRKFQSETGSAIEPLDTTYPLALYLIFVLSHLRKTQGTTNNPQSSRSHMLIFIRFIADTPQPNDPHIVLCDLAGIENRFVCENADVQRDFADIKNGAQLVYAPYLESKIGETHRALEQILGTQSKDTPWAIKTNATPYPWTIKADTNSYTIDINFDNPSDSENLRTRTEWRKQADGTMENHYSLDQFNSMLCFYHNFKAHYRWITYNNEKRGKLYGIGWSSEPDLPDACRAAGIRGGAVDASNASVKAESKPIEWGEKEPVTSNVVLDKSVPEGVIIERLGEDFLNNKQWSKYHYLIRTLLRLAQKPSSRKRAMQDRDLYSLGCRQAFAYAMGINADGTYADQVRAIDKLGVTLYSISEALKKYNLMRSECEVRRAEGTYINYSIRDLQDFIRNIMRQRNVQPDFYSACSAISNNVYVSNIITPPQPFEKQNQASIQGIIANRITQVRTGNGLDTDTQNAVLRDLVLVIFNVVKFVTPSATNYIPPKAYVEIGDLEMEVNRVQSIDYNVSDLHQWKDGLKGTSGSTLINYNGITPSVLQALRERLEAHRYTLAATYQHMLRDLDLIQKLPQSDSKYVSRIQALLTFITLSNAETFLGSFEFIDRVSKFGLAKNLCVIPLVSNNKDDAIAYSNLGMQVEYLRDKVQKEFTNSYTK